MNNAEAFSLCFPLLQSLKEFSKNLTEYFHAIQSVHCPFCYIELQ